MQGYQAVKMHAMGVNRCRWGHAWVRKVSKKLYLRPHSVSCKEPFESWPVFFLKSTVVHCSDHVIATEKDPTRNKTNPAIPPQLM